MDLTIRAAIDLQRHELPMDGPAGPLFAHWLPDGRADAISVSTADDHAKLLLWFNRYGVEDDGGYLVFNRDQREVDPVLVERQGSLCAGELRGELVIADATSATLSALTEESYDQEYRRFAKRVARLVYEGANRLISTLRLDYGQYWLRPLEWLDSREQEIDHYCRRLNLLWSIDQESWSEFFPDHSSVVNLGTLALRRRRYEEILLTKEDWGEIAVLLADEYSPDDVTAFALRAHELQDQGSARHSLIEAVVALEAGLSQFLRRRAGLSGELKGVVGTVLHSKRGGLTGLATTIGIALGADASLVERAVLAIKCRNQVVHDGYEPDEESLAEHTRALLGLVDLVLPGPRKKRPPINHGNSLGAPTDSAG